MADEEGKLRAGHKSGTMDWKQAVEKFRVDIQTGLTEGEGEKRIRIFGFNEIPKRKKSPLWIFLKKFWGLTAWMLELTMLISFILGKYLDLYIVGGLLLFNSILSFLQEEKASDIVNSLTKNLQVNARVLREGKWRTVQPGNLFQEIL